MKFTSKVTGEKNFERTFAEFMTTSKREMPVVMREQMRGIVRTVISLTPPSSVSKGDDSSWSIISGTQAKKQGENAIAGDLFGGREVNMGGFKVKTEGFFIVSDTDPNAQSDYIAEYKSQNNNPIFRKKQAGQEDIVRLFTNKQGIAYGVERQLFRPNASVPEMLAHIARYRSPKTGRMSKAGLRSHVIGRSVFIDRMVIGVAAKNALLKHLFSHVGWLASAWKPAAQFLGIRMPAWIAKLDAPGHIKVSSDGLSFEIGNDIRYAKDVKGLKGRLDYALNSQAKKMEKRIRSYYAALEARAQRKLNSTR